jgi:hypothetical protein
MPRNTSTSTSGEALLYTEMLKDPPLPETELNNVAKGGGRSTLFFERSAFGRARRGMAAALAVIATLLVAIAQ